MSHINDTIHQLQDEQEKVQKKTFTNWINMHLEKHDPPLKVTDLFLDMQKGVLLLYLLESLSGDSLPIEKGANLKRVHYISNVATALRFLENKKIKLVNINPTDIVDGKPSIVLGLIWTIILYFQIEENTRLLTKQRSQSLASQDELLKYANVPGAQEVSSKGSAKQAMLHWVQKTIAQKYGVSVKDFGLSWRDGMAFNAIIHNINPELVDLDKLPYNTARVNLENAFRTAEEHLGIPRLLDPEDVDVEKPDEKSIMTYLAQFLEKFHNPDGSVNASEKQLDPATKEGNDFQNLMLWLDSAAELLCIAKKQVTDQQEEYQAYQKFMEDLHLRTVIYEKLRGKAEAKQLLKVSESSWRELQGKWDAVADLAHQWHRKLDAHLPGRLGEIGNWLHQVEQLLDQNIVYSGPPEETVKLVLENLELLRAAKRSFESNRDEVILAKRLGKYNGQTLATSQMQNLEKRIITLTPRLESAISKLEYDEAKFTILSGLNSARSKVKRWESKCGHISDLEEIFEDYKSSVQKGSLVEDLNRGTRELKKRGEILRNIYGESKAETLELTKDFSEIQGQVEATKVEILSKQPKLEESVELWHSFIDQTNNFQTCISEAELVLEKPLPEQEQFFEGIEKWNGKLQFLNSTASRLLQQDILDDKMAEETKRQMKLLEHSWQETTEKAQLCRLMVLDANRNDYRNQVTRLKASLAKSELLLASRVEPSSPEIRQHISSLTEQSGLEGELMEVLRSASRASHVLVKDCNANEITGMKTEIQSLKEGLAATFKGLAERTNSLQFVLPKVESVNTKVLTLMQLAEKGEVLLDSPRGDSISRKQTLITLKEYTTEMNDQMEMIEALKDEQRQLARSQSAACLNLSPLDATAQLHIARIQRLLERVPVQIKRMEFFEAHETFSQTLDEAQKELDTQNVTLQQKLASPEDLLVKYQEVFTQGDVMQICSSNLEKMKSLHKQLSTVDKLDSTVGRLLSESELHLEELSSRSENLRVLLEDVPEKWKQYNKRFANFENYVKEMNELTTKLKDETLSAGEYRQALERFKELQNQSVFYAVEAEWLSKMLDELSGFGDGEEARKHLSHLTTVQRCFDDLKPNMESMLTQSATVSDCHGVKEAAEKHLHRLRELAVVFQDGQLNDLNSGRLLLAEQEEALSKMLHQKQVLEEDIGKGVAIINQGCAPMFLVETINDANKNLTQMISLAQTKCQDLRVTIEKWEEFESNKVKLKELVKNADVEFRKPPPPGGHEAVKKELNSRRQLLEQLHLMQSDANSLCTLQEAVAMATDVDAGRQLQEDCVFLGAEVEKLKSQTEARIEELHQSDRQWVEFLDKMVSVADWLEVEAEGSKNQEADDPEKLLAEAQASLLEVKQKGVMIDALEKDLNHLSRGTRSREVTNIKTKLANYKRQQTSIETEILDKTGSLSDDVTHWHRYRKSLQELVPVFRHLEEEEKKETSTFDSFEEIVHSVQQNRELLSGLKPYQDVVESCIAASEQISHIPGVAAEADDLHNQWETVLQRVQHRQQCLDKANDTQTRLNQLHQELTEGLKSEDTPEPNLTAVNLDYLLHQMDHYKVVLEDANTRKKSIDEMAHLSKEISPMLSQRKSDAVAQDQISLDSAWQQVADDASKKYSLLTKVYDDRKELLCRMDEFDKFLTSTRPVVEGAKEIYLDEASSALSAFQKVVRDCKEPASEFQQLEADVSAVIEQCTSDDKDQQKLSGRLSRLHSTYSSLCQLADNRVFVVMEWMKFYNLTKASKDVISSLQQKLERQDINLQELDELDRKLVEARERVREETSNHGPLQAKMNDTRIIFKDRKTQRSVSLKGETDSLYSAFLRIESLLQRKTDKQNELTATWTDFQNLKSQLVESLTVIRNQIEANILTEMSLKGVESLQVVLHCLESEFYALSPSYEEFRKCCQHLTSIDITRQSELRDEQNDMENLWELVQQEVTQRLAALSAIHRQWKLYSDARTETEKMLELVEAVVGEEICLASHKEALQTFEIYKRADTDLNGQKRLFQSMVTSSSRLADEGTAIPGFNVATISQEQASYDDRWNNIIRLIMEGKEVLRKQLVLWEQVDQSKMEVDSWLCAAISKLQLQAAGSFNSAAAKEALIDYRNKLPQVTAVFGSIREKAKALEELNKKQRTALALKELTSSLEMEFHSAEELANALEDQLSNFTSERSHLENSIQAKLQRIVAVQEQLQEADDVSGNEDDILRRLKIAQAVFKELEDFSFQLEESRKMVDKLASTCSSSDVALLAKAVTANIKRCDTTKQMAENVSKTLLHVLERLIETDLTDEVHWLESAAEKIVWCSDLRGDKYSMKTKHAMILDVEESLPYGEEKRNDFTVKYNKAKPALSDERQKHFEEERQANDAKWTDLNDKLHAARIGLEEVLQHWEHFEELFNSQNKLMSESEAKLRRHKNLLPSLEAKEERLETLLVMSSAISNIEPSLDELSQEANIIFKFTSDNKPVNVMLQLKDRHEVLISAIKEQHEKQKSYCEDHRSFNTALRSVTDWLRNSCLLIENQPRAFEDVSTAKTALESVKKMLRTKQEGNALLSVMQQSGEKLYPATSLDGREIIHQQIRDINDQWETYADRLDHLFQLTERLTSQLEHFDRLILEATETVEGFERKNTGGISSWNTLTEKKLALQECRVLSHDMLSYKLVVENVMEIGRSIPLEAVQQKWKNLNSRFLNLVEEVKQQCQIGEEIVSMHCQYADSVEQCQGWLRSVHLKLTLCQEPSTDKKTIGDKIDKVMALLGMKEFWESKYSDVMRLGQKVSQNTGADGQKIIHSDLDQLHNDWIHFTDGVSETLKKLQSLKLQWDEFEQLHNDLMKWLLRMEHQLKEEERKASLAEKEVQVHRLKELEKLISGKTLDFTSLKTKSEALQITEEHKSVFIDDPSSQHRSLLRQIQNTIEVYEHSIQLHRQYEQSYVTCTQLLNGLNQRLSAVVEDSEDAQKVKESSNELKSLLAEKATAAVLVNQVMETGEKLHSSTSAEGSDIIRHQNRALRVRWERLTEDLKEAEQNSNLILVKLSTLEEGCQQFSHWMNGVKRKVADRCLQGSLEEKKTQLLHFKVLNEDVASHEKVLDSLIGQSRPLVSGASKFQAPREVQLLIDEYRELSESCKGVLSALGTAVEDHMTFEDAYQKGHDLLSSLEDTVSSVRDETGNHWTLQNKLDKFENSQGLLSKFVHLLSQMKSKLDAVLASTSETGQSVLKEDLKSLEDRNDHLSSHVEVLSARLRLSLQKLVGLEANQQGLEDLLQSTDVSVKAASELKSTLEEKQKMANEMQRIADFVESKKADVELLSEATQNLFQSSQDIGLTKRTVKITNQYKAISKSVQDLLEKWNAYVAEHLLFEEKLRAMMVQMEAVKETNKRIYILLTTSKGIEKAFPQMQALLSERSHGQQELNAIVSQGEKLCLTTATPGRERIRQQVFELKTEWSLINNEVDGLQKKAGAIRSLWLAYSKDIEELTQLLSGKEQWMDKDEQNVRDTLEEKQEQLQTQKVALQEIISYEKLIDDAELKSTELRQLKMNESEFEELSAAIIPNYTSLQSRLKEFVSNSNLWVTEHADYLLQYSNMASLLQELAGRVKLCNTLAIDKNSTRTWQELLHEIDSEVNDGESKLRDYHQRTVETLAHTGTKGRLTLEKEKKEIDEKWQELVLTISQMKNRFRVTSEKLNAYEDCLEKFSEWIKIQEAKVKAFIHVASVEEKRSQVNMLQNLLKELTENEMQLKNLLSKEAHFLEVQAAGGASKLSTSTQQLDVRYHSLLRTAEGLLKNAQETLMQHELYCKLHDSASSWLMASILKYSSCAGLVKSKEDVQKKRAVLQELSGEREQGLSLISQAAEAGEKLHPTTSADGRETIRQQIRLLKQEFESFIDDILRSQREIEVLLVDWSSYEESLEQLGNWLDSKESLLSGTLPLHSSLEDKKMQMVTFKSSLQDIQSYQSLIDGVVNKAQVMAQTTNDLSILPAISRMNDVYVHLCSLAKERVEFYENIVKDHLAYKAAVSSFRDWLGVIRERLKLQQDISGDLSEAQSRLEKLETSESFLKEGETKLKKIEECAERVIPNTLTEGQDMIFREGHDMKNQFMLLKTAASKMRSELRKCVDTWKNFERLDNACRADMRNAETRLRSIELQPTLATKREQLFQIKRLHDDFSSYGSEIVDLNAETDVLAKLITDTPLSSLVDQLSSRYLNQLSTIKETLVLWERLVSDQQVFEDLKQNFIEWHRDASSRLRLCLPSNETKFTLEGKLSRLRELYASKDEGYLLLEDAVNQSEVVIRNTSTSGRDSINRSILDLQGIIRDLVSSISTLKEKLELSMLVESSFSSSVVRLTEWLHVTEDEINGLEELPATMMEQKSQLEEANVLSLKILGQKSEFVLLGQMAARMVENGFDKVDVEIAETLSKKFTDLSELAQMSEETCEQRVMEHLAFQDACNKASDWLNLMQEKLLTCSDVKGDYHSLRSKRNKLLELVNMLPNGKIQLSEMTASGEKVMRIVSSSGWEKIREEVQQMNSAFEQRSTAVQEKFLHMESAIESWKKFSDSFEIESSWLRNMENKSHENLYLKFSLDEKQRMLDEYGRFVGEIESWADRYKETCNLSQVLLETCSDAGIAEQMAQFKSRYTALLRQTRNQLKVLEHHVEDHKHFISSCDAFTEWIQSANTGLWEFRNVARDKEAVRTQLKQFYEFSARKEEAVILMISADVYGKKAMLNTSAIGSSKINDKLNDMQRDWNDFEAALAAAKFQLESSLIKWSDVDSSLSQLSYWMVEVKKRLKEEDLPSNLTEKKAQLQRSKALLREVSSKGHLVAALKTEAKDFGDEEKPLTEEIDTLVMKYEKLCAQATTALSSSEESVTQHVQFNECCEEFNKWLHRSRESLAACQADGTAQSFDRGITSVAKCEESLSHGEELLQLAKQSADLVYQRTSSAGCPLLRQGLETLTSDFEDFKSQLSASQRHLFLCKKLWEDYNTKKMSFCNWLQEIGNNFKSEISYGSSLQEKEEQFHSLQAHHEEILAKQKELDILNEKAKELMDNSSTTLILPEVTEMLNNHQSLLSMSQEFLRKSESAYHEHARFDQASQDYDLWLEDVKTSIQNMESVGDEKDRLKTKQAELDLIESSLGKARSKMLAITEQGNLVLFHTSASGTANVRQRMKDLNEKFELIKSELMKGKMTLEGMIGSFSLYEYNWEKVNSWVEKTENSVKELLPITQNGSLQDKKVALINAKVLVANIDSYKSELDNLNLLFANLPGSTKYDMSLPLRRWESLSICAGEQLALLQQQIADYEQFLNSRSLLQRLLSELQTDVNSAANGRSDIDERLQKLKALRTQALELSDKHQRVVVLGEKVAETASEADAETIQLELGKFQSILASLLATVDKVEAELETAKKQLSDYHDTRDEVLRWLDVAEKTLKDIIENMDVNSLDQSSVDIQNLNQELLQNHLLQKLLEKSQVVHQLFPDCEVTREVDDLMSRFTSLQSSAKDGEEKVTGLASDVAMFNKMILQLLDRLNVTKLSFEENSLTSGDVSAVQLKCTVIENLLLDLEKEEIGKVKEKCQGLLNRLKPKDQEQMTGQLKMIQEEYGRLVEALKSTSTHLKSWMEKHEAYSNLCSSLEGLLSENESDEDVLSSSSDLSIRLDQLKRLKASLDAMRNHEEEVLHLSRLAKDIESEEGEGDRTKEVINLAERIQNRKRRLEALVENLEASCGLHREYFSAMEDCERKLVAMSLQFTDHRSVCIQSYEISRQMLRKHGEMMLELNSYESVIDNIQDLGQKLIASNPSDATELKRETEAQLTTIVDTYRSLQTAAIQIKDRLEEAVEHWQSCEQLADDCSNYINSQVLPILDEDILYADKETVILKTDDTKVILKNLQKFSHEISAAVELEKSFVCFDSSLHKDVEFVSVVSLLQQKVQHVNEKLSDVVDRLNERLGSLKETEDKWLEAEKLQAQLKDWIDEKELEVMELSNRSGKLHPDVVQQEIQELEGVLLQLQEKGPTIEKLTIRFTRLVPNANIVQLQVQPIRTLWETLVTTLKELIASRRGFLTQTRSYHRKQTQLNQSIGGIDTRCGQVLADGTSAENKSHQLQSPIASHGTQTMLSVLRSSTPVAPKGEAKISVMRVQPASAAEFLPSVKNRSITNLSNSDTMADPSFSQSQCSTGITERKNLELNSLEKMNTEKRSSSRQSLKSPITTQDIRSKKFQRTDGTARSHRTGPSDNLAHKPFKEKQERKQTESFTKDMEPDKESGYGETVRSFCTEPHDSGQLETMLDISERGMGLSDSFHNLCFNDTGGNCNDIMANTISQIATAERYFKRSDGTDVEFISNNCASNASSEFPEQDEKDDIMSCHSGLTEPDPEPLLVPSHEFATQTLDFRRTLSQSEGEEEDINARHHLKTKNKQKTSYGQVNNVSESSLQFHLTPSHLETSEMTDFGQQTPLNAATQTPLLLRLGSRALHQDVYFVADMDANDDGGGLFLQPFGSDQSDDFKETLAQDFGTQTFGQILSTLNHVETQTACSEDVHSRKSKTTKTTPRGGLESKESHERKKERKEKRKKTQRKREEAENESVETDSSRADLLKLMLRQVRAMRQELEIRSDGRDNSDLDNQMEHHTHKTKEKKRSNNDTDKPDGSKRESRHRRQDDAIAHSSELLRRRCALMDEVREGQKLKRRHSIGSLFSRSETPEDYEVHRKHVHHQREATRPRTINRNRAKTPPVDWKPVYPKETVNVERPHFGLPLVTLNSALAQERPPVNSTWRRQPTTFLNRTTQPILQSSPIQTISSSPIIFIPDGTQTQNEQKNAGQTYVVVAKPQKLGDSAKRQADHLTRKHRNSHHASYAPLSNHSSQTTISLETAKKEARVMKNLTRKLQEHSRNMSEN